ncbi:hypothetical protein HMPREF0185_00009 [Brevundimonas diminuta 470-4]|nr:hypothetical protein HMPREF0185_00009 [Brevundimonas diminuta 470-4]
MKTFKAQVRINGHHTEVRVQAENLFFAKNLLEAQYGKGSVAIGPIEVR